MSDLELIDTGPSAAGWHAIEAALRCTQLYFLTVVKGVGRYPVPEPLARGSMIHVGLAHHYERKRRAALGLSFANLYAPLDAMVELARRGHYDPDLLKPCTEALIAYFNKYAADDYKRIVEVEAPHEILVAGERYTARVDLHIIDRSGRHWFVDHKSTSQLRSSSLAQRYGHSGQILGLWRIGAEKFGSDFGGVRLNLLNVGDKPRFERLAPDPAPGMMQKFDLTVKMGRDRMRVLDRMEWAQVPPVPSELTCETIYGPCSCLGICQYGVFNG